MLNLFIALKIDLKSELILLNLLNIILLSKTFFLKKEPNYKQHNKKNNEYVHV